MRKKIIIFMVCFVFLAGAFGIYFYQNDKDNVIGAEMFSDEFIKSVTRIDYSPFDESEHISIKSDEKIKEFFEILKNEEYAILDEKDWVEGFYSFEFFTKDGVKSFGVGSNVITFDGTPEVSQYYVVSGNNLVRGIIEETVMSVNKEIK